MSNEARRAARRDRALASLADQGMALARDLHERARAARNADELCDLALAFERVSRTIRETIALEAELRRSPARDIGQDVAAPVAAAPDEADVGRRKSRVKFAVERAIRSEAKGREALRLLDALDDRLEDVVLQASFMKGPVEAQVARVRRDLGLSAPSPASRRSKLS